MNPMYDFSNPRNPPAEAKAAPPPKKEPKPSTHKPRRRPPKAVLVGGLGAFVLVVGGGAFAYSRSQDKMSGPDRRFCASSLELAQILTALGAPEVGPLPDSVRPEAINRVLTATGAKLGGLEESAPSEIRADVKQVLADLRAAAAGDVTRTRSPGFVSAETRIASFQKAPNGCLPAGSAPSDFG